jgi:aspartate kinase
LPQDLTPRAQDSLVSFGERLSTRLFAAYLRSQGVPAQQHDAFDLGVITNDNFVNAEVRLRGPGALRQLSRGGRASPLLGSIQGFVVLP